MIIESRYIPPDDRSSRRFIGLGVAIILHIGMIYALLTGLGQKVVDVIRAPIEAKIIGELKEVAPKLPPPPPVMPKLAPPPLPFVPLPEIKIERPPPPVNNSITAAVQNTPPQPAPAALPAVVAAPVVEAAVRTAPVLDAAKSCRLPQYPSASRRSGETGTVGLKFLINPEGKVIESMVEKSSGFKRLDEAALDALSLCRFKPGTLNGRPEASWAKMQYVWKLD